MWELMKIIISIKNLRWFFWVSLQSILVFMDADENVVQNILNEYLMSCELCVC